MEACARDRKEPLILTLVTTGKGGECAVICDLTPRQIELVLAGGLLAHTRGKGGVIADLLTDSAKAKPP